MIRVDLLQESEKRYQGAVSYGFILVASVITIMLIVLGFDMYLLFQNGSLQNSVEWNSSAWDKMEPEYKDLSVLKGEMARIEKLLDEAIGWNRSRVDWSEFLVELAGIVPAEIQIQRFDMSDMLTYGELTDAKPNKNGSLKKGVMRAFRMSISGVSRGDGAEETAVAFVQNLREAPIAGSICANTTLQAMRKDRAATGSDVLQTRLFDVEAVGEERVVK